jgi:methylmalonyl-CoA mutase
MSDTTTLPNWENLVKKQLKTEDIYPILEKENLEEIEVKPFYTDVKKPLANLPREKKVPIW